jgi:hypothetical protein
MVSAVVRSRESAQKIDLVGTVPARMTAAKVINVDHLLVVFAIVLSVFRRRRRFSALTTA